jgi:hypothetical protein
MGEKGPDRRQFPRVNVGGRTKGQVNAVHDVALMDISLGGALVEHTQVVQPGITFDLSLALRGNKMRLKCRVVRSLVHRSEVQRDGQRKLIYRTGVEFLQPTQETRQVISDYIRWILEEQEGAAAKDPGVPEPLERAGLRLENQPKKPSRRQT